MDNLLLIACFSDFDEPTISKLATKLPKERCERALRAKNPAARAGAVLGYFLLAYGTHRLLGKSEMPMLSYGECGKPYLSDRSLAFSITHSKSAVAVLLSKSIPELGIDLEEVRPLRRRLIERFSSDTELSASRTAEDAILLWRKKEAASKHVGLGLKGDLRKIETEDTRSIFLSLGGIPSVLSVSPADALPEDLKPLILSARDLLSDQ